MNRKQREKLVSVQAFFWGAQQSLKPILVYDRSEPSADVRKLQGRFELYNMAVATSGNYRHFFQVGEHKLSHTMDPKTQQPLNNSISSVTVFAQTFALADAWATAIWVGGERLGQLAISRDYIEAAIVV